MKATRVFYEGYVQGVGFRWTTKRIAQGYEVCGWVRNLPDGRVEMQVSGEEEEVEAFLHGNSREHAWRPYRRRTGCRNRNSGPFKGFRIV